jgi:hypothetical protein
MVIMKKFKFLAPASVLAAVFSSDNAIGIQERSETDCVDTESFVTSKINEIITVSNGAHNFGFVLKRSEVGELIASHRSHISHSSHKSHSSGY